MTVSTLQKPTSGANGIPPIEYRIYSDLEHITELSSHWDELVRTSPGNAAFRSIDWYTASCRKEDSWVPFAIVAFRAQNVMGILPFVIDRNDGTAKFPHHGADYNDVIAHRGNPELIASLLTHALLSPHLCRRILLSRVRPDSCCAEALPYLTQQTNIKCLRREIDSYWYIQLPASFDDYLESRSRAFRKDVRRTLRNLERERLVVRELYPGELDPVHLPVLLLKLCLARHKEKCSLVRTPYIQRFLNEALPPAFGKRFLRAFAILRETQILALDLCMATADGLVTWSGGFLPEVEGCSPGTALFACEIQQAIAAGAQEFDFMRGDEEYKRRWSNSQYNVSEIELTPGAD